jgi:hypothetical protein
MVDFGEVLILSLNLTLIISIKKCPKLVRRQVLLVKVELLPSTASNKAVTSSYQEIIGLGTRITCTKERIVPL